MWDIIQIKTLYHPACIKAVYNALIHPYLNYAVLNWGAGHQKLLFNLLKIYTTKLWNFLKHPTKPLWMKYIYKITFWQSTICLKCLLVSLCTLMKTINFHHILTNISNLFWQFINTPPDLHVQKISSYPG